jgi:hypothetical protein
VVCWPGDLGDLQVERQTQPSPCCVKAALSPVGRQSSEHKLDRAPSPSACDPRRTERGLVIAKACVDTTIGKKAWRRPWLSSGFPLPRSPCSATLELWGFSSRTFHSLFWEMVQVCAQALELKNTAWRLRRGTFVLPDLSNMHVQHLGFSLRKHACVPIAPCKNTSHIGLGPRS